MSYPNRRFRREALLCGALLALTLLTLSARPSTAPPVAPAPTAVVPPSPEDLAREFRRLEQSLQSVNPSSPDAVTRLREIGRQLARANALLAEEVARLGATLSATAKAVRTTPAVSSTGRANSRRPTAGSMPGGIAPGAQVGPGTASGEAAAPEGGFFARRGLRKFHRVGCYSGERIRPGDRVYFKAPAEAVAAGLEPCKVCRP